MQKIWTFVKNGNSPPATLMDVPQNVPCVVRYMGEPALLIRIRVGSYGCSMTETGLASTRTAQAAEYTVVGYYATPPVEPLPATLRDAKPYQLVNLKTMKRLYWKDSNNMVWSLREDGGIDPEGPASSSIMLFAVTSVSNLTAVLTEV